MLLIVTQVLLMVAFAFVFYQDIKEREVYQFLFPLIGIASGYLFYRATLWELFYISILINLLFVSILMILMILYIKLKLKMNIMDAIGLGDLLLLFFLCFSFSTISFVVVLICSFVFSLTLHLIFKNKSTHSNVPLAGYMSLFFAITYLAFWTGMIDSLYTI